MDIRLERTMLVLGGAIVGATASYLIADKALKDKYETALDLEIQATKNHYEARINDLLKEDTFTEEVQEEEAPKKPRMKTAQQRDLARLRDQLAGRHYVSEDDESEMEAKLQAQEDAPWVIVNDNPVGEEEEEVLTEHVIHDGETPYVIDIVEFSEGHPEYDKITITWYAEDETLADERDEIIPEIEANVGHDALNRFGDGSGNDAVVYVRNDRIATDFEVTLDEGSYAHLVLGIDPAPKKRKVRKMRDED